MRICVYAKQIEQKDLEVWHTLFALAAQRGHELKVETGAAAQLQALGFPVESETFSAHKEVVAFAPNVMLSMGGDGTLLETVKYIRDSGIPVLGINLGRLGFLSQVRREDLPAVLLAVEQNAYKKDKRTLLEIHSDDALFSPSPFGLNDFTVHKQDTGSMINVDTFLNGEFFTRYWCDGLIIATPTGSTAYSLSCGGPIIFPDSRSFVLTPVAPHNLNVRPIIVPDSTVISLRISGRGHSHMASLDSRTEVLEYHHSLGIEKADFHLNLVKISDHHFIESLRQKLKWGSDYRNL